MDRPLGLKQEWVCPNCKLEDTTRGQFHPNRFHTCPRLRGLTAPMVPRGVAAKVEARDREDYVGTERVTTDQDGRPVMSVITTRDDGQDAAVFAPVANLASHTPQRTPHGLV